MAKNAVAELSELESLREKVRDLEAKNGINSQELTNQLGLLKKKQVRSAAQIPYKIIDDHQNVFLYTKSNHRVGPLHPNNAVSTMLRWAEQGVQLYTKPFSESEVAEYKKTKEWTDFIEKNRIQRAKYKKKNLSDQFQQFAEIIASQTGRTVQETNKLA